jgi:hypothetical protein
MVNYNPDLQGWADAGEDPQWMENALARVRSRQRQSRVSEGRRSGMYVYFNEPFRALLDEAAARRDMSMASYMRRAVGAFIAHDLNIPFTEVVRHGAQPVPHGAKTVGNKPSSDNGRGKGPWLIEGLKEL